MIENKILFLFVFLVLSYGAFGQSVPIRNNGNSNPNSGSNSCCGLNMVQVNGAGTVKVQPDIAYLNVGISVNDRTSSLVTQLAATKINQAISILTANKIKSSDYETNFISVNPQYNYESGNAVVVGQTASQTLKVTVRNIGKNGETIGTLIDQLSAIDGIKINGVTFDKENKSANIKQARKIAFDDAKTKAVDIASLSNRRLGQVLLVIDNSSSQDIPIIYPARSIAFSEDSVQTPVQAGLVTINYNLSIKFALN